MFSIAIDGPSGAGKSSVAKALAKRLGAMYLDTGALYRAIGYYFIKNDLDFNNADIVSKYINKISLDLRFENAMQIVLINGEDVTQKIRTNEVSMAASAVSAIPKTRDFLMETQRNIARKSNVIMDGRDIGTVVLPGADVKIFLTASLKERTMRRFKELNVCYENIKYDEVLNLMQKRDINDSSRKIAPLKPAQDAIIFDSTDFTFEQVADKLEAIIKEKIK